jgi:ubiquinone/menaquinone biosynthesis C-methylase UbiE
LTDLLSTLLIGLLAIGLTILGWWLLISTEGVYLGRRVVVWLYDLYADRYDDVKNYYHEYEHLLLARPIMAAISPHKAPLVLDVATGTGRLPLALLSHPDFQGHIICADLSRRMVSIAASKLQPFGDRVSLLWNSAEELPFADNIFDVVTCLESLEFMSDPRYVLGELVRVLRPGGVLLITNRISTRLMPGKTWTTSEVLLILQSLGMVDTVSEVWQADYDQVWGRKAGNSGFTGARPLGEVLRCPRCRRGLMTRQDEAWVCERCNATAPIGQDNVIELCRLQAPD